MTGVYIASLPAPDGMASPNSVQHLPTKTLKNPKFSAIFVMKTVAVIRDREEDASWFEVVEAGKKD